MSEAPDILSMSDEEFLKNPPSLPAAPTAEEPKAQEIPLAQEDPVDPEPGNEPPAAGDDPAGGLNPHEDEPEEPKAAAEGEPAKPVSKPEASAPTTDAAQSQTASAAVPKDGETKEEKAAEAKAQDPAFYEGFFKKVMAPFKANGRTIQLKDPEEVIQLMQMGANYTRKMQELVPHRKVLTMLQNNELLDEGKLSFLIDISRRDPEAIKKLIKDSGIDPMEIDTTSEPAYREGNHRVSDEEVNFRQALDDMKSTPERTETLRTINNDWDQASKEALWKNPQIMEVIHGQRETGMYDRVVGEMQRLQTLGQIPANIPFLQAYKTVGDKMAEAGAFADIDAKVAQAAQAPIATRAAAPKPAVTNNDRAAAASPTRQASRQTSEDFVNPLSMSDDEFLEKFKGRV